MQCSRLATSKAALAVRLLISNGLPVGTAIAGPSTSITLRCVSAHSSWSIHTAAASLLAPTYQESAPSPVAAAMSTAASSVSGWIERISIWLAAPKSKISAHRRGQKRQHQKLKWAPVMSRCPKCERVMRQREVVSRCPVPLCPCGVSRPSAAAAAAKAGEAVAQQESTAINATVDIPPSTP